MLTVVVSFDHPIGILVHEGSLPERAARDKVAEYEATAARLAALGLDDDTLLTGRPHVAIDWDALDTETEHDADHRHTPPAAYRPPARQARQ